MATNVSTAQKTGNESERDLSYWKQRALTAEGRYNTLKPRLDDTIFNLRKDNAELQRQLDEVKVQLANAAPDPIRDRLMNPQVRDVLGDDTTAAIVESITTLREEVAKNASTATNEARKVAGTVAYDSFVGNVRSLFNGVHPAGSIDEINTSPGFAAFLDGRVSPSGNRYRDLFNSAVGSQDASSTANFFIEYADLMNNAPGAPGADELIPVKDSVTARVTPKTVTASTQQQSSQRNLPTFTSADIEAFKQDVARGKYRNRHSEMVAIQKSIEEAYLNNRIKD